MCSIIKEQVNLSEVISDDDTNLISAMCPYPHMIVPPKNIVLLELDSELCHFKRHLSIKERCFVLMSDQSSHFLADVGLMASS